MIEIKAKRNPIAGYTGCMPMADEQSSNIAGPVLDSHIPGYVGYVSAVKSENLYAKTFGKITENCYKGDYPKGIQHPADVKYLTTTKQTYAHPNSIKEKQLTQGKISGVKLTTFSNAAKYLVNPTAIPSPFPAKGQPLTTMTYEQARQKAFGSK